MTFHDDVRASWGSPSALEGFDVLMSRRGLTSPNAVGPVEAPQRSKGELTEDVLLDALRKAEQTSRVFGRDLKFRYRKEADVYQVEVIDRADDKVIRKIPPDEVVKLIENINKMLGILFDDRF
ncbi:MAG: flagellar protein FlaG [Thermanaerothrix sp.]|nr:flagellar protein FlaG [Thermanaerothrix sp.]